MKSAEQHNTVADELRLNTISSDIIRTNICTRLESIDAMRHISPRWNSLAIELLNNRKGLPPIDYLQCSAEIKCIFPEGYYTNGVKRNRLDQCSHWTFHLVVPDRHKSFFGVSGWKGSRCAYHNSTCSAHERSYYSERSICDANSETVTTAIQYSRLAQHTDEQGKRKLTGKLAYLTRRCSRFRTFEIQNQSNDLKVVSDAMGNVIVDDFVVAVLRSFLEKQIPFYIDFINQHAVRHFSLIILDMHFESYHAVIKKLIRDSLAYVQKITLSFCERVAVALMQALWETVKSEISEPTKFYSTVRMNKSISSIEMATRDSKQKISELNLANLSSDIILNIIRMDPISIESQRVISPRWNTIVREYFKDRKRLPVIKLFEFLKTFDDKRSTFCMKMPFEYRNYFGVDSWQSNGRDIVLLAMPNIREPNCPQWLVNRLARLTDRCSFIEKIVINIDDILFLKDALEHALIDKFNVSYFKRVDDHNRNLLLNLISARPARYLVLKLDYAVFISDKAGITNFIAKAICVVPYIELNFPSYTGTFFMINDGVRIHWEGQLKQLLRETGNCKGRVIVEFSGRPNYTQPIYQVRVSIDRAI